MNGPSKKRRFKKKFYALNIVPILDIVFILIFFLLTSSHFIKIYNIGSDLPVFTDKKENIENNKDLNLRVEVSNKSLEVYTGNPSILRKKFSLDDKEKALSEFNHTLSDLKKEFPHENNCVLEPHDSVSHQLIVNVMDNVRETFDENHQRVALFNQLIFGNL